MKTEYDDTSYYIAFIKDVNGNDLIASNDNTPS